MRDKDLLAEDSTVKGQSTVLSDEEVMDGMREVCWAVLADSDVAASHLGQFHATWLLTNRFASLIERQNKRTV